MERRGWDGAGVDDEEDGPGQVTTMRRTGGMGDNAEDRLGRRMTTRRMSQGGQGQGGVGDKDDDKNAPWQVTTRRRMGPGG